MCTYFSGKHRTVPGQRDSCTDQTHTSTQNTNGLNTTPTADMLVCDARTCNIITWKTTRNTRQRIATATVATAAAAEAAAATAAHLDVQLQSNRAEPRTWNTQNVYTCATGTGSHLQCLLCSLCVCVCVKVLYLYVYTQEPNRARTPVHHAYAQQTQEEVRATHARTLPLARGI